MNDSAYFQKRASEERERAATCEDNLVALTHLRMADEYERRARALLEPPAQNRVLQPWLGAR